MTQHKNGPIAAAQRNEKLRKPRFAVLIALTFSGMILALILLAGRTDVPQITRAPGTLVPDGDYTQIEVLDGGIVEHVFVRDGDQVAAGDLLVALRHPDLTKEQQGLREQLVAVERKLVRGHTILQMLEGDEEISTKRLNDLRAIGLGTAAAALEIYAESQRIKALTVAQQTETLQILQASQKFTEERVSRKSEELERARKLHAQGLTTLRDMLQEADRLDALRTAASDGEVRLAEARSALSVSRAALAEHRLALRQDVLNEVEDLTDRHNALSISLAQVEKKLAALQITAPSHGVVQTVAFPNQGEVIAPGETIFELLPSQLDLMVEARIPNGEIGHVGVEQSVNLTIDTYDARRFGKAQGKITAVSPVPLIDEQTGETYFRATIALEDVTVGQGSYQRTLQAGMTVVAEMQTGEKSLLAYMLKPVHQTMTTAFSER